jgi:nickel transport protein
MKMMRKGALLTMVLCLFVLHSLPASAHRVSLFAYQEEGVVYTEAYFVDGTPCRNAKITATDAEGSMVVEGLTDEDGLFSFPDPLTGNLNITVRASMGHGSEIQLIAARPDIMEKTPRVEDVAGEVSERAATAGHSAAVDETAIEKIVEDRISPIRDTVREIQKNQGKPTLGKILGGLGWIVGMAGAYLWGVSRGRNRDKVKG